MLRTGLPSGLLRAAVRANKPQALRAPIWPEFDRWNLTPAEEEVALLSLKGLSHKDIVEVRSVTEAPANWEARGDPCAGPVVPQNVVRREMSLAMLAKVTQRTELGPLCTSPTVRHG